MMGLDGLLTNAIENLSYEYRDFCHFIYCISSTQQGPSLAWGINKQFVEWQQEE
jgi:hypothetical protein